MAMKKSILILTTLSIFYYNNTIGQCTTNAGPDRIICTNMFGVDTTQIGVTSSTIGGIPPYTYSWETNYTVTVGMTTITKTASDYLNDTTISTPLIIAAEDNPVIFVLTVKDSIGNICKDTTVIKFSRFFVTLLNYSIWSPPNNNIFLDQGINVSSNFPPFQYLWKPSQGLVDSTSLSFWIHPDSSIAYYVIITDSAGCSFEAPPYYYIYITPLGINKVALKNFKITTFPNPSKDIININVDYENSDNLVFEFFDTRGELIKKIESKNRTFQFRTGELSKGVILYKVTAKGYLIGEGKLIVE